MSVKLIVRQKEYEVKAGMSLMHAMQKIEVTPEAYLAVRNGEVITEDEVLNDGDVVQLVAVISGGSLEV
ncbi:MAG TPA: MoaD/ThiS family protein [Anaerolineaceae bacterium]|nr:MoaD/ThiS family protein [Anaerolineaceae bacterium]